MPGDHDKLRRIAANIRAVGSADFRQRIATQLAREALTQVKLGFRQSRDPDGNPWVRTAWSSPRPLRGDGRLNNSFTSEVQGGGIVVGTNVKYAPIQNYGGVIRPKRAKLLAWRARGSTGRAGKGKWSFAKSVRIRARPMIPAGKLSPIWSTALKRAASAFWRAHWKVGS